MNPLDLPGPQFLGFYAVLLVVAVASSALLRWYLRLPGGEPAPKALDLSPCEVAYLAGGEARAVHAAVARLVHEGILAVNATNRKLTRRSDALPAGSSRLEQAVHAAIPTESGVAFTTVRMQVASALAPVRNRLKKLELLVAADRERIAILLPLLLALSVPLLGVVKIGVGISRDRPVGFLVVFCIVSVVVAFVAVGRRVNRSRRGDRALARFKEENAALGFQAGRRLEDLSGDDLSLAVGLFGMGILAGGPLSGLEMALKPPPRSTSWSSSCGSGWVSSCGSSCGGGGCGGGCGGGGCGGCGG